MRSIVGTRGGAGVTIVADAQDTIFLSPMVTPLLSTPLKQKPASSLPLTAELALKRTSRQTLRASLKAQPANPSAKPPPTPLRTDRKGRKAASIAA
jgi:hypothetical protein